MQGLTNLLLMIKSTITMKEDQWIIDIANTSTEKWVSQVENELQNLTGTSSKESERWRRQSIYRIPSSVKDLCSSKGAYTPQTVSIGPYHYGEEQLKGMEEHKHRALLHFLSRSGLRLKFYVDALEKIVEQLKDAYDKLEDKWERNIQAFLQLMVIDGCFILELLRTTTADAKDNSNPMGYKDDDPVFSNHGKLNVVPYLTRDMLMLENQLPMPVLTTLLAAEEGLPMQNLSVQNKVTKLILKFFSQDHITDIDQLGECFHILDLCRQSLLWKPNYNQQRETVEKGPKVRAEATTANSKMLSCSLKTLQSCCRRKHEARGEIIRSATELYEAGVTMKKSKTKSLQDISFHQGFQRGILRLPPVVVDDTSESLFLNLMAFERFHVGAGNEVTSYVFFMDRVIDSAEDVSLLHKCGIIQNALGSDEAVAELFNSISKDITLDPDSSLDVVHKNVSEFCQMLWPRWMAKLKHSYCDDPWVVISVVAAIVLFVLTGIQTYYSIIGYNSPK